MSTKAKRHTHKYYQMKMGSNYVWACGLGDCNHFMPHHMRASIQDGRKNSICWNCNKEFQLNGDALDMREPICLTCQKKLDMIGETLEPSPTNIPSYTPKPELELCSTCHINKRMQGDSTICYKCWCQEEYKRTGVN